MKRAKIGDVFKVRTSSGFRFVQYVHNNDRFGQLIKVIDENYNQVPSNIKDIVVNEKGFCVLFPVKGALKRKFLEFVVNIPINEFKLPKFMRQEFHYKGSFSGWEIINTETLYRERILELKPEHHDIYPWGIWGDEMLLEILESNWKFKDWTKPSNLGL